MNPITTPIRLIPGESIGQLKLGMIPDEILSALEEMFPGSSASVQVVEDRMFRPDGTRLIRYMGGHNSAVSFFFMVEYRFPPFCHTAPNGISFD